MCSKLNFLKINKQIERDVTLLTGDECVKINSQKDKIVNESTPRLPLACVSNVLGYGKV